MTKVRSLFPLNLLASQPDNDRSCCCKLLPQHLELHPCTPLPVHSEAGYTFPWRTGAQPQHSYILAPQRVQAGDEVVSGSEGAIRPGNSFPLSSIPIGQAIHNVELYPGRGGQMARAAGVSATLITKGAAPCMGSAARSPVEKVS